MQSSKAKLLLSISLILLLAVLTGCSGGGGGGATSSNPSAGQPADSTSTYLAYKASLHLVDPDTLADVVVDNRPIINATVTKKAMNYNMSTREVNGLHRYSLLYIPENDSQVDFDQNGFPVYNGGPVYRVSMVKGQSTPQPVQVSSLKDACSVTELSWDDIIYGNSYMVVRTAGADGKCDTWDDKHYLIHSTMNSTSAPIPVNSKWPFDTVMDDNMQITGFLVDDQATGTIQKCDLNLLNCTVLISNVAYGTSIDSNDPSGNLYLCIDTGTESKMYVFNGNSLTRLNATCYTYMDYAFDSQAIYAVDPDGSKNVMKLTYGSTDWQVVYSGGDVIYMDNDSRATLNYVKACGLTSSGSSFCKIISKTGDYVFQLDYDMSEFSASSNSRFYYTKRDPNTQSPIPCYWSESTRSETCYTPGSRWLGWNMKSDFRVMTDFFSDSISHLFLLDGNSIYLIDDSSSDPFGTKVLLGQLPQGYTTGGTLGVGDKIWLVADNGTDTRLYVINTTIKTMTEVSGAKGTPIVP